MNSNIPFFCQGFEPTDSTYMSKCYPRIFHVKLRHTLEPLMAGDIVDISYSMYTQTATIKRLSDGVTTTRKFRLWVYEDDVYEEEDGDGQWQ